MTSEEKVKKLWPGAKCIDRGTLRNDSTPRFMVVIKPGRCTFGIQKLWAWSEAWISITQDEELSKGAK